MARSRLHELSEHGVSVWIDSLSREMLETGELARLIEEDAVVGVTSNPTIFQKALSEGDWYDEQLRSATDAAGDRTELFIALAQEDIRAACDVLRRVWDEGDGQNGYVSLEVDPNLAYDRRATFEQALRFHEEVDRPNLFVKIPGTEPGLGAIEDCIARGKLDQRDADLRARAVRGGRRGVRPWARAARRGRRRPLHRGLGRVLLRLARRYRGRQTARRGSGGPSCRASSRSRTPSSPTSHCLEAFSGARWDALAAKGASTQRCLWASTSTKNPAYRDVLYVEELVGPETVNTMPAETIAAFQDHGEVRGATLTEGVEEAQSLLDELASAGVDYADVVETLEREGVQKFSDSFTELLEGIETKLRAVAAR